MLKIGINSAPRIVAAEVNETQDTSAQQVVQEQVAPTATKSSFASNQSLRSEAMFSSLAMQANLMQHLKRNREAVNSESLQNAQQLDQQALTQQEAEQQIGNQPDYVKPFSRLEATIGAQLPKTLYTGDGDDKVEIQWNQDDQLYHVYVNDKEAWSGDAEQLQSLTINTGAGNDHIFGSTPDPHNEGIHAPKDGVTINTGDGNDAVFLNGSRMKIDTGRGDDQVVTSGSENVVSGGEGTDWVKIWGDRNQINTGGQEQDVAIAQGKDNLVDGKEPETPGFPELKW